MLFPWNKYPYTDFHQLNDGWVVESIKELGERLENFITLNSLVFADPLRWDITRNYAANTIVIDENGDAYFSIKPVPDGVLLSNTKYWNEVFNFSDYVAKANKNLTDRYEKNVTKATADYSVGNWLIWDDVLYVVTAPISEGQTLVIDTNIEHFTVEDFIKDFVTTITATVEQYKTDIDASELAYKNALSTEITETTANLEAQLNAAISGVTVDSEVIDARVSTTSITFSTLGDNIRKNQQGIGKDIATFTQSEFLSMASGFIPTNTDPIDPSVVTANASWCHGAVTCKQYDKFVVDIYSPSANAISYAFIDAAGHPLEVGTPNIRYTQVLEAPLYAAKLVLNNSNQQASGLCFKLADHADTNTQISDLWEQIGERTFNQGDFVSGGYVASGGQLYNSIASDRIRLRLLPVTGTLKIDLLTDYVKCVIAYCDNSNTYKSLLQVQPPQKGANINPQDAPTGATQMGVFLVDDNGDPLDPSDYDSVARITYCTNAVEGKQTLIYRYGDDGNDWCWVRLPANYNSKRKKPYKAVICNHGNGWTMDGSIKKANYTDITMYLLASDPDYISDPTRYTLTTDPDLVGSNPTLEALLAAGYVVCGAENYGDLQYANTRSRNAAVNFYEHMIANYNIEKSVYMIGASAGALLSLNFAYLRPGRVKAMILQYPLTCLVAQYENYSPHRAGIRSAYGISDPSPTIEQVTEATATHDPYNTDVVDGIKTGSPGSIQFWYSPGDTTCNPDYNAIALYNMMHDSIKDVSRVICTGPHGDLSHFDPSAFLSYFNAH